VRGLDNGISAAPIRWADELDSTNAEARRLASAGEVGPLWIAARRQTAGRGRQGRGWETGEGNLAASLLVATDLEPAKAAELSFVSALAAGALVQVFAPSSALTFKWPNDVRLKGAKVCGILIESGQGDAGLWLAIGFGVNLKSAPEGLDQPATCLADHLIPEEPSPPTPDEALEILAEGLDRWVKVWSGPGGFDAVRKAWLKQAEGIGKPCSARLGDGETVDGVAKGLDKDGALLLRLASGQIRRITAGDVFFQET
jgi:BirA family biotin operon repressor/biotin-[acetyl-CoA-carboxylase] ligase